MTNHCRVRVKPGAEINKGLQFHRECCCIFLAKDGIFMRNVPLFL
jgi:hypothetical protein